MGPASGTLRGTGAGVIAAVLVALAPALPAALGDGTDPVAPQTTVPVLTPEPAPEAGIPAEEPPAPVAETPPVVEEPPAVEQPPAVEEPPAEAPPAVDEPPSTPPAEEAPPAEEPAAVTENRPAPTFKSFRGTPAAANEQVATSLVKAVEQAESAPAESEAPREFVPSQDSVLGTYGGSEDVAIPEPEVLTRTAARRAATLPALQPRAVRRTGTLVAVADPSPTPRSATTPAARPPAPATPAPTTTPTTPAANATPAAETTPRTEAPRKSRPKAKDDGGILAVPTVVFDALADSVAFVPGFVWGALGGLAFAALALLALAIVRDRHARALGRERTALLADLEALEGAVMPALPEALGGLALSVTSSPATGPVSGGDFHDAFPLSGDRVAVLVGDVAGEGRQALADAQLVRHAVRAYLEAGLDPRSAIAMTGAVVDDRDEPLFATVVVAVHDRRTGTLTYASAGHEPPVLVSEQGAGLPPVTGWSPPLGAGLETGRRQTSIPLPEGTSVCLLTDGVTEARSDGERIGVSRVIKWLSALGPGAMSSDVVARLRADADPTDDVTVCMLRALTPTAPNLPRIEEAIVEGGDPTVLVRFLRDCGLPLEDAEEAGDALAAAPDGTRMVASVEVRGGRAIVELAPLKGAATDSLVG
ncbi:MAG: SpoIIE family protein phosphatase [Solirubrobacteraceae bacterium]